MRRLIGWLVLAGGVAAGTGAFAQYNEPYYRNDPYYNRNDPYYNRGGRYDRGRGGASVLDRTLQDLNRAARGSYYGDGHERNHFQKAMEELDRFQNRLSSGHWDGRAIDKAIENISHLANDDRLQPRDRQILTDDLYQLREFRANRGYGYARPY